MSSSLVLGRHVDGAFNAFDLDQSGFLYVSDAVLALDSLLIACWGNKEAFVADDIPTVSNNNNNSNNSTKQQQQQSQKVSSGSGSSSDSLTLPGVSRSKILQALKHALLKASVDPDEVAVSARPVVTLEVFQNTATALLAPLPGVSQSDVDTFAAFQCLNQHDQEKTRVDRRALRRALFAEYDSDVYVKKNEDDELQERLRSRSASATNNNNNSSKNNNQEGNYSSSENNNNGTSSTSSGKIGTGKFDGIRNMIGCDELMLNKFSRYPQQGFSFDEWKVLVTPGAISQLQEDGDGGNSVGTGGGF